MKRIIVLAVAGSLCGGIVSHTAQAEDGPPGIDHYEIIRGPDDAGIHMPRMFVLDPHTARMWVLTAEPSGRFAFVPVPYEQTITGRYGETEGPPLVSPEGTKLVTGR